MRFIFSIISTALICYGGYWFWQNNPDFRDFAQTFAKKQLTVKEFQTLEVRYSPDQIMSANKSKLLPTRKYAFLDPKLKFHPFILLDVKFSKTPEKTEEGTILWSLVDGEMILNTKHWNKTHGYEDCINAHINKAEFFILNALAQHKGLMDRNTLFSQAHGEEHAIESTIESCKSKKLIVEYNGSYRLHFENPKLAVFPITHFSQPLMKKSYKRAVRLAKKYSANQIKTIAEAAFDGDFAIRGYEEIFLPVYSIDVKGPNGINTTYWSAVNGTRMDVTPTPEQKSTSSSSAFKEIKALIPKIKASTSM